MWRLILPPSGCAVQFIVNLRNFTPFSFSAGDIKTILETELQVPVSKMQLKGWKSGDVSDSVSLHDIHDKPVLLMKFKAIESAELKPDFNADLFNAQDALYFLHCFRFSLVALLYVFSEFTFCPFRLY